jgi:methylated-DNA-[protein]-cysteine S-methyltransferase
LTLAQVDTPIGRLTLVGGEGGLRAVLWPGEAPPEEVLAAPDVQLRAAADQLGEYFAGRRTAFDLSLDLAGTEFQRRAWLALQSIPFGTTRSYAEQARLLGRPRSARAVGGANACNPLPIVLPCHRLVGADGSLTGFGGGLDVKRRLLEHEARVLARA